MANTNKIVTKEFSNSDSEKLYREQWPAEPATRGLYEEGLQCGGCSCFAKFNFDWGLCCCALSRHHLETVFEHFTCPAFVDEGWEAHSFCQTDEEMDELKRLLREDEYARSLDTSSRG